MLSLYTTPQRPFLALVLAREFDDRAHVQHVHADAYDAVDTEQSTCRIISCFRYSHFTDMDPLAVDTDRESVGGSVAHSFRRRPFAGKMRNAPRRIERLPSS